MRLKLLRALLVVTVLQLLLAAALYNRGFPYFGSSLVSNAPVWESPVALAHLPGLAALTVTGLCCGFHNSLVLGPKVTAGHIRMDLTGVMILAITNWAIWLVVVVAFLGGWHLKGRRGAALRSLEQESDENRSGR